MPKCPKLKKLRTCFPLKPRRYKSFPRRYKSFPSGPDSNLGILGILDPGATKEFSCEVASATSVRKERISRGSPAAPLEGYAAKKEVPAAHLRVLVPAQISPVFPGLLATDAVLNIATDVITLLLRQVCLVLPQAEEDQFTLAFLLSQRRAAPC